MKYGQETEHDFVKNHSPECSSEFDADYFHFNSDSCASCAAEAVRWTAAVSSVLLGWESTKEFSTTQLMLDAVRVE